VLPRVPAIDGIRVMVNGGIFLFLPHVDGANWSQ
jgi:hypothetical protein